MSERTPPPSGARRVRLRRRVALAAGAAALSLAAAELLLAAVDAFPPQPLTHVGEHADRERRNFVADPRIGWRMRPGASFVWRTEGVDFPFRAGPDGFRVDERDDPPPPDPAAPRIAFVGDSFTFGTGVRGAETFAERTAARLGAAPLNRGMAGFGIDQMACTVEHVVLPEAPDLAVVAFIVDDFERSLHAWREPEGFNKPAFKLVSGALAPKTADDRPPALLRLLDERSRLHAAFRGVMRRLATRWPVGEWWKLNAACFDAMDGATRRAGVPLLVVLIPTPDRPRPFPALARHLAAHGVEYVDLLAEWGRFPAECYWPRDGHLNAAGHERTGETLALCIERRWPGRFARAR